jgi:hypothetical protein
MRLSLVAAGALLILAFARLAAADALLIVEPGACDYLTAHEPAPDVAYAPDRDAFGNPLPPAEVDPQARLDLPEDYWLRVFVPLNQAIDIPAGSNLEPVAQSEIDIGVVRIKDGELFFDGRRLSSQEQNAIAAECRRRLDESASAPTAP